jgi:hypothetical protein
MFIISFQTWWEMNNQLPTNLPAEPVNKVNKILTYKTEKTNIERFYSQSVM